MSDLKPGELLRCQQDDHVGTINDINGDFVDNNEYLIGDVVMFLEYDDGNDYFQAKELAYVLFGDVKCSVVLADFERI